MKNLIKIIGVSALILTTSCERFLDVNKNPNKSTTSSIELALPSAIIAIGMRQGGYSYAYYTGFWSQYYTQSPVFQAGEPDQYLASNDDFNRGFIGFYSEALTDLKYVEKEAMAIKKGNYVAISKFLQAYLFQLLTDLHGDVPFSEALLGEEGVIAPKYDSQQSIYDGLIQLINQGLASIDTAPTASKPGNDDMIYRGDMEKWKAFANTLKLRIYMRQSDVRPAVAQAGIQELYANGVDFMADEDDAAIGYVNVDFNKNPLFQYLNWQGGGNEPVVASKTVIDYMTSRGETERIDALFVKASTGTNKDKHVGIKQGDGVSGALNFPGAQITDFSRTQVRFMPNHPVVLISVAERYFLEAEAAVRGWGSGNAGDLYEEGIKASFHFWHKDATTDEQNNLTDYLAHPLVSFPVAGTMQDKIKAIISEKWIACTNINNVEAWNEWRRTGYPVFNTSTAGLLGPGNFPVRFPYPDNELTRNPNTPTISGLTQRVWWDVN